MSPMAGMDRQTFQTQARMVYERLFEMITCGQIKEGESLSLRRVAAQLGVSIAPVRDALQHLNERGLVEKIPRFGYRLCKVTRERVEYYYAIRTVLEAEVARLAAERITDDQVEDLRSLCRRIDALIDMDAYGDALLPDNEFHSRLAQIAGCPYIARELDRLKVYRINMPSPPRPHWHSHQELLDAIARRDPMVADEAMRAHIDDGLTGSLAGLEAREEELVASGT